MGFLDLVRIVKKKFLKTSEKRSRTTIRACYKYSDILLRVFIDVSETGQYTLLVKQGEFTEAELIDQWAQIVEENSKQSGQLDYNTYRSLLVSYGKLIADYIVVKSDIVKLAAVIDDDIIEELRRKGYKINTTSTNDYIDSLNAASKKSDNLVTRIQMKLKELERFHGSIKTNKTVTYAEVVATLNYALGFNTENDLTLAGFHAYQRVIKQNNGSTREKRHNNR